MRFVRILPIIAAASLLFLLVGITALDRRTASAGLFGALGKAGKKIVSPVTGLLSGGKDQDRERGEKAGPEEGQPAASRDHSGEGGADIGLERPIGALPKARLPVRPPGEYKTTIDRVVAVVDHEVITLSELEERLYDRITNIGKDYTGAERRKMIEEMEKEHLKSMVDEKLQFIAARKLVPDIPEKDVEAAIAEIKKEHSLSDEAFKALLKRSGIAMEEYKVQIKEQIMLRKAQNISVRSRIQIDEKEIADYYARNINKYNEPDMIKARQIFFRADENTGTDEAEKVKNKALAVLRMAKSGADFAELAGKYSEDVSAEKGGDLGFFKRGELLPALEEVAFSMEEGDLSDLIRTRFGFHIMKIEKMRSSRSKPLEAVKDSIRNTLFRQRADEKLREWVNELRENTYVETRL